MPQLTVPHRLHDLVRVLQHGGAGKTGGHRGAAVQAGQQGVLRVAAQLQRLFDHRGKVAPFVDVGHAGVSHHRGGEHPVGVAGAQGHDAVGGEQDGRGDVLELPLLVLPCGAKVALEVGVAALQLRVAVGGQHLRVGVDVDAPACSLFQQLLCVVEVVAGNHDERPLFNGQRHLHRFRIAKRAGVGRVQQLHAAVAGFSCGLHQLPQGVGGLAGIAHGLQGGTEEPVQLRVDAAQHPGVVVVGGHAPQAEQHKAFQAAPVGIRFPPEGLHVVVRAGAGAGVVHPAGQRVHGGGVKVHVGNGGEQPLHQQPGLFRGRAAPRRDELPGKRDERPGEPVLCGGCLGRLATHPRCAGAGGAARRLLTLKTKHLLVHTKLPFCHKILPVWAERGGVIPKKSRTPAGAALGRCSMT